MLDLIDPIDPRDPKTIDAIIKNALTEDLYTGDITTIATTANDTKVNALIKSKDTGVLSGIGVCRRVFELMDSSLEIKELKEDGDQLKPGDVILGISGFAASILSAERVSLNFLGRACGIATTVNRLSEKISHTKTKILDSRKTQPGVRLFDKRAVIDGGGANHRFGLFDMYLIKENHIQAAGGVTEAVQRCVKHRAENALVTHPNKISNTPDTEKVSEQTDADGAEAAPQTGRHYHPTAFLDTRIVTEVTNMEEARQAIAAGSDRLLLDNMTPEQVISAVAEFGDQIKLECSGGITEETIKTYADAGVDYISIGMLTHTVKNFDLTLLVV